MGIADIAMVAVYHWVEKRCKARLAAKRRKAGEAAAPMKNVHLDKIVSAFAAYNVDLKSMPKYEDVNILRLFANSWKHEPEWSSTELAAKLGLDEKVRRHLDDKEIRSALAERFGAQTTDGEASACDAVRAAVNIAHEFLRTVTVA